MIDVFEWADVLLSSAFLTNIRCSENKTQKEVIIDLASAAGVYTQWDSSDKGKLCGTWPNILKAQAIFNQYLSEQDSLGVEENQCTETNSNDNYISTVNCNQIKEEPDRLKTQIPQKGLTDERKIKPLEHNEVYVNITISTSGFTGILPHKKNVNLHVDSVSNVNLHLTTEKQSSEENVNLPNSASGGEEGFRKLSPKQNEENKEDEHLPCKVHADCRIRPAEKLDIDLSSTENSAHIICDEKKNIHNLTATYKNDLGNVEAIQSKCTENPLSTARHMGAQNTNENESLKSVTNDKNSDLQNTTDISDTPSQTDESTSVSTGNEKNVTSSIHHYQSVSDTIVDFPVEIKDTRVSNYQDDDDDCEKELSSRKKLSCDVNKTAKRRNYEELAPFKFFCSKCSFKSKRESHYQRHMQLHNQVSNIFECEKCSFRTIRLGNLRRHELTHSETELSCDVCSYRTLDHKLLIRHQRTKHINKHQDPGEKEVLACSHCDYTTTSPHLLKRHYKRHKSVLSGSELTHECSECPYKAGRKEHLTRHINNVHGSHRPFLCHHCGKAFKRQDALKQHSAIHMNQPPFKCPTCDKGCRSQAHLRQHMAVHSARRLFLCELCGASFKTRAVQRKHIFSIHHHPKAYSCLHCSRRFNTKFALRRHMKQHYERKQKSTVVCSEVNEPTAAKYDASCPTVHLIHPEPTGNLKDTVASALKHTSVAVHNPVSHSGQPQEEKMTVHIGNCNSDHIQIIPAQTFIQQANETATALLYLTGSFSSY